LTYDIEGRRGKRSVNSPRSLRAVRQFLHGGTYHIPAM
jgi:hypothetical protein